MARHYETIDEYYEQLLIDLFAKLQRLPFGNYKRAYDGAAEERGHLLPVGDYQALMLWLQWSMAPRKPGRPRQAWSAMLRRWQEDQEELKQERKKIAPETGKRQSRMRSEENMAKRHGMTTEGMHKRLIGRKPSRGRERSGDGK